MSEQISPDRLQGQLIAMAVQIEAILRVLPAQGMREILEQHQKIAPEVEGHLLNTQGSDAMLDAYTTQTAAQEDLLRKIQQAAIFRDSAAGRL